MGGVKKGMHSPAHTGGGDGSRDDGGGDDGGGDDSGGDDGGEDDDVGLEHSNVLSEDDDSVYVPFTAALIWPCFIS